MIEKDWYVFDQKIKNIIFSGYKWVYCCHEKTSHHNKNKHEFKIMFIVVHVHVFVLVYDGHTISMVLCTLSFEILKYISTTTCKQHNSPVGSLGFWVDQFLWDSWVPLTHKFTSLTNWSFSYSCKFMILPPHEKQWFLGLLYLMTFLILNISKDSGFYLNSKMRDAFLS